MKLVWDEAKRQATLAHRGLDFADAGEVLRSAIYRVEDTRKDYGERRFILAGFLRGRLIMLVYTMRGDRHHIISMRKANAREQKIYLD